MYNKNRCVDAIAFYVFNKIISQQRFDLIQSNKIPEKIIKYFVIIFRCDLYVQLINQKSCRFISTLPSPLLNKRRRLHQYKTGLISIPTHLAPLLAPLQGRLAELIRSHIRRGRIEAFVSVQLNHQNRSVEFDEPILQRYHEALLQLKARFGLKGPVTLDHLLNLPPLHRDPFDRMLICQAIAHGLAILTPDERIRQYPVRTVW